MNTEKLYNIIKDLKYSNYHKHCHYSNVMSIDSTIKPKDYINRAIELGHKVISSVQHGVKS